MRDKLLKIVERIEPNYHGDYKKDDFSQLSRYVDKRLTKRYAQDIIDNLDIIIKYVNNKNMHIICNEVITNHPGFIKQFIKYLGNFNSFLSKSILIVLQKNSSILNLRVSSKFVGK